LAGSTLCPDELDALFTHPSSRERLELALEGVPLVDAEIMTALLPIAHNLRVLDFGFMEPECLLMLREFTRLRSLRLRLGFQTPSISACSYSLTCQLSTAFGCSRS
jgi:hypothetical protein